jgi:uncharacterized repeat protein (TIGR03803 family)
MKMPIKAPRAQFGILTNRTSKTIEMPQLVSDGKPVLALLMRLLRAAVLGLPVLGAHAGAVLTTLHSFTGTNDGAYPMAGLVQGSDGSFYGTTYGEGTQSMFEMTTNGTLTGLYPFVGFFGTVFKISPDGVLTNLHSFTGTNDGSNPQAALVQGSDGYLYGTTVWGGTNNAGTLFRISTNGILTSLYSFTGGNDGRNPVAALVQGSDGNLYGTTYGDPSGALPYGTVFKITTNGGLTTLYRFRGGDGATPTAALVQGSDGDFYGTTSGGGTYSNRYDQLWGTLRSISLNGMLLGSQSFVGFGTVFKISPDGVLTNLYSFTGTNDGSNPLAALVQGSDGNFYGTTSSGGTSHYNFETTYSYGTLFRISTNGTLTSLFSFTGGQEGGYPYAGLVRGNDGDFYGTTRAGGSDGNGTVFKISPNGARTALYTFGSITIAGGGGLLVANGSCAGLLQGSDGNFYGTTFGGGQADRGTIFRLTVGPTFQAATLTNNTLNLTWTTDPGKTYQLQFNSDLSSTNWANLGRVVTATAGTLSFSDYTTNGPTRSYRVVLSP